MATTTTTLTTTCQEHNRRSEFICFDCNMLVCPVCLGRGYAHNGHEVDHIDNIKKRMIEKDKKDMWCKPRLDHLWKTLQLCAGSYQSLQQTHASISSHFEQLIKVIIAEEHKIKTPINVQMSHIQSTINNIINEIKDINHIINIRLPTNNNDNDNSTSEVDDTTQLIESITSCKSIDEFTDKITQSDMDTQQQQHNVNDDELMSIIIRHNQHTHQVPYDEKMLHPSRIEIDVNLLTGVRKQIESCFKLIQPGRAGKYDGHIMSLAGDRCSMFSLDTFKWTSLDRAFKRSFVSSHISMVYARGHVYVFGGSDEYDITSYSRYSLFDGQCHTAPLPREDEPFSATTACYDGQKYIYIICEYRTKDNDGVYRLNVLTLECDIYGKLPYSMMMARANFKADSNSLVIVGEEKILLFNIETKESNYFYIPSETEPGVVLYIYESCFDGHDNLYMKAALGEIEDDDADRFVRITLSTKKITKLAMWPEHKEYHRLIYDQWFGIIFIGGRGKNFRYSIPDDQWTLITYDNVPFKGIAQKGACLIRDRIDEVNLTEP
ncbi:hypothetical protein SAMD00019534_087980, partial [Acytostelium subglobosum LB1]|uniref:hypothetical protein n=1 Tax=Acytostelium subglobosum LB1 TaxID=1410327 RepID=UPI0006448CD4